MLDYAADFRHTFYNTPLPRATNAGKNIVISLSAFPDIKDKTLSDWQAPCSVIPHKHFWISAKIFVRPVK
jgi:hypothetical protein